MEFGKKLKEIREHLGYNQADFAKIIGLPSRTYWDYEKSKTDIPTDKLLQIANVFKVNTDRLFGNSEIMFINPDNIERIENEKSQEVANECVTIDHIHINPSCGNGTSVYDDALITPIQLGINLIKNVFNANPNNLKVFKASGDSMETTISDGDLLLVDVARKDFANGGIFLLTINNEWYCKRLKLKINGDLEIISDNPRYEKEIKHPNDEIEIKIIGKVIRNLSKGL